MMLPAELGCEEEDRGDDPLKQQLCKAAATEVPARAGWRCRFTPSK